MPVNCCYPLVRTGLQELGGDEFLNGQDDSILASNSDSRASILNGFDGVFDLVSNRIGSISIYPAAAKQTRGEVICVLGSSVRRERRRSS